MATPVAATAVSNGYLRIPYQENGGTMPFDSEALIPFRPVTIEPSTGVYLVYRG